MPIHPRYLLVGPPRVGKSTVVARLVEQLRGAGVRVGGFVTAEVRQDNHRVGFRTTEIGGPGALMAYSGWPDAPRHGRYGVDVAGFERIALPALDRAAASAEVVVLDELGQMQLLSDALTARLSPLLTLPVPLVATVQAAAHPTLDALKRRDDVELVTVTEGNRSGLAALLVPQLLAAVTSHHCSD